MPTNGENRKHTIKLPRRHAGQWGVFNNRKRFNWLAAGRRWRKTTFAMSLAAVGAAQGESWLWGAPTFDQVRIGWAEARKAAGGVATFRVSTMTATFPGGGVVMFRSLDDPNNARGHTANGVVIDEAPYVKAAAWYESLRPMLIDTGGTAWMLGTPRGRNWYWREHAAANGRGDSIAWQVPTLGATIVDGKLIRTPHPYENPHIPFAEIERLWHTMPERIFRQEILAEFIEDTGGVFRNVDAASIGSVAYATPGHLYAIGVDWGKYNDFTVFSVLDLTAKRQVHLERFNQIDYTVQFGRLANVVARYTYLGGDRQRVEPHLVLEANSMGAPLVDFARRRWGNSRVSEFTATNQSKKELIDALALAIERGDLTLLENDVQQVELKAYETTRLPGGGYRYSAPEGLHDDTVIALALSYWPIAKPKPVMATAQVNWYGQGDAAPALPEDTMASELQRAYIDALLAQLEADNGG